MSQRRLRVEFTDRDDRLLCAFLARYNPSKQNRMGNAVYQMLTGNEDNRWSWSSRHSWSSWRERYKKNEVRFDRKIRQYQKKHNIRVEAVASRNRDSSPTPANVGKGKKRARPYDDTDHETHSETSREVPKRKKVEHVSEVAQTSRAGAKMPEPMDVTFEASGLLPPPPTSDYTGEIFEVVDSEEESEEEMAEVVDLVDARQSQEEINPSQNHKVDPFMSHELPASTFLHGNSDSSIPPTLPTVTPIPQTHARANDSSVSHSSIEPESKEMRTSLHSTPQISTPVTLSSNPIQVGGSKTIRDGEQKVNQDRVIPGQNKRLYHVLHSSKPRQDDDDIFASPSSVEVGLAKDRGGIAHESSDEDTLYERRRRRHQPPNIVESAFGRSVMAVEGQTSPPTSDPILHPKYRKKLVPPGISLPSSKSAEMLSRQAEDTGTSLDRKDRIQKLKQELAAKSHADSTFRPGNQCRHPFSQDTQEVPEINRALFFDESARDRPTVTPQRTSLVDLHPFSQSSATSAPSTPIFSRTEPSKATSSERQDLDKPVSIPAVTPRRRNSFYYDTARPGFKEYDGIENSMGRFAYDRASGRMHKVSGGLSSFVGSSRPYSSNKPVEKALTVDDVADVEVAASEGLPRSALKMNRPLTTLNEEAPLNSTQDELNALWSKRQRNRLMTRSELDEEIKREPGATPIARLFNLPAQNVNEQQIASSSRVPIEPVSLEPTKSLRFSSPRLGPSAVPPPRSNSPLDALSTSRRSLTASGSINERNVKEHRHDINHFKNSAKELGGGTPRIDLSARKRRVPRTSTKARETSVGPSRASVSSVGAQSASTARLSSVSRTSFNAQTKRASLLPDASPTFPLPSQSLDFPISDSDRGYIMRHGIQAIIDKLAVNHGFQQSVTWNVYKLMRDLHATDQVLKKMRQSANNTGMDVIHKFGITVENNGNLDDDSDDDEDKGDDDESHQSYVDEGPQNQPSTLDRHLRTSVPARKPTGGRQSLNWKPADKQAIYSPHKLTRASEWLRLDMQGRKNEALLRESRRASLSVAAGKPHRQRVSSETGVFAF